MRVPREPIYLERQSYRRRRLQDGARALPFLGLLGFGFPLLWSDSSSTADGPPQTAASGIFIFAVWAILIVAAAVLAVALRRVGETEAAEGG